MKRMIITAKNLLFPPKCANCGELLDVRISEKIIDPLCKDCRAHFESEKLVECPTCGLAMQFCACMPKAMKNAQCTALLKLVSYKHEKSEMPIRKFICSVKDTNYKPTFEFFAEQMRPLIIREMRASELLPEDCVITYLPRSYKNKAKNGVDQSLKLANELSRITGIELVGCFRRRIITTEQKKLDRFQRRLNMNSAYVGANVGDRIKDRTVILVDDIVTTGSSMAACARIAYSMGAYAVFGVSIGLTEKNRKNKRQNH